jgi:hypothetical protein
VDEDAVADVVPGDWGNVGWTGDWDGPTDDTTATVQQYCTAVKYWLTVRPSSHPEEALGMGMLGHDAGRDRST